MMEWIEDIVSLCGQRCTMIDIGQSYEGRKLPVIKVRSHLVLISRLNLLFVGNAVTSIGLYMFLTFIFAYFALFGLCHILPVRQSVVLRAG